MMCLKVKRWQTLLAALGLLLVADSAVGQLTYTTDNGAITITGYSGTSGEILIPASINGFPVTSIDEYAFTGMMGLTNVSIPNTVTNIGALAFLSTGLKSIGIPGSVTKIEQATFMDCPNLAGVTIGPGVRSIEVDAFYGCTSLTNLFLPQSLTNIFSTAFVRCTNLTSFEVAPLNPVFSSISGVLFDKTETVLRNYPAGRPGDYTFPNSVTHIGDNAFAFCFNLKNVVLPAGVTNIGRYAFYGCNNVTNFTLSSSLQTIREYAFNSCSKLASIVVPPNVLSIETAAFSSTALTNVLIPASATNVASGAFSYCYELQAIQVATNNPAYVSVAGILFTSNLTTLIKFPIRKSGTMFQPTSYTIPAGVTTIADEAFRSCMFSNVLMPTSITSIGRYAFDNCSRLTNLLLPDGLTYIGYGALASGITNLIVPSSVTIFEGFGSWSSLRNIYFLGDAPGPGTNSNTHQILNQATAYYLPGTEGWKSKLFFVWTRLWLPTLASNGGTFINQNNQFSFDIQWASGQTVVIEACTNLPPSGWIPLSTNTLTSSSTTFTDAGWRNHPERFYRVRMQ